MKCQKCNAELYQGMSKCLRCGYREIKEKSFEENKISEFKMSKNPIINFIYYWIFTRIPKRFFLILYIIIIIIFIISLVRMKKLPPLDEINRSLLNQPVQTDIVREEFNFSYRKKSYEVTPLADYELWGLIVTKNNIKAWFNYYKDKDSVNLKDICVVWGKNIENGVYSDENISYKSGEFTCYVRWTRDLDGGFYIDNLSNNHLLTANIDIQEKIRDLNIGDQVHLKGKLVDINEDGNLYMRTSLSRSDSNESSRSGGACEVFYVDEIEILRTSNLFWNYVYKISKNALFILVFIQLTIFILKMRKLVSGK